MSLLRVRLPEAAETASLPLMAQALLRPRQGPFSAFPTYCQIHGVNAYAGHSIAFGLPTLCRSRVAGLQLQVSAVDSPPRPASIALEKVLIESHII
jgi:hypothetical protein